VQSSTVLLMSIHGVLPELDAVIFADTGWEPQGVYDYLEYLQSIHPIHVVAAGPSKILHDGSFAQIPKNIREDALKSQVRDSKRWASIPFATKNPDGSIGRIRRQCTKDYKVDPVRRRIRQLLNGKRPDPGDVELWMGISFDERKRVSFSRVKYIVHHYPLIELEMTRRDCLEWIYKHELPIPSRSACIGCPYHSNAEWKAIQQHPVEWQDAVEFDRAMRNKGGILGDLYLHSSCKPLDEINFKTTEDAGQMNWITVCEGMCGV
jgi:hypothetical protein